MATLNFPDSPSTGDVYKDGTSGFSYEWNGTVWISTDPSTASNIREIDNISSGFDGSDTTFTLQVAGVNVEPANVQQLIISVGGVMQNAGQDFTLSGSTLTFTTAPSSGLTFFGVLLGTALSLNTVADGSVGTSSFEMPLTIGDANDSTTIPGNAVVSGILTAGNAYVSGILTAKTLNYDNVTDIFSTGIITATAGIQQTGNEGLHVSSGITTVGILTATKIAIVKSDGALLEVTTNTGAADATLRLSEGATGSTSNGGGMFYSGADNQLHITCGTDATTKRITIDRDSGRIGINTTASLNKALTIKTVDSYEASIRLEGPNNSDKRLDLYVGDAGISTIAAEQSAQQLSFRTAVGEAIRIASTGEVGIGLNNPADYEGNGNNLVVGDTSNHNGITILTGSDKDGRIGFADGTGAASYRGHIEYQHGTGIDEFMKIGVAGGERLRISSGGGFKFSNGLFDEKCNITAGKLSDNQNIDLVDGMVHYFSTQESTTATPNIRIDSSNTLQDAMDTGDVCTVTLITTAAAAGYSANLTIDGNAVTEEWVGGEAPSAGGDDGLDIYSYTIICIGTGTGDSGFKVIANLTSATN